MDIYLCTDHLILRRFTEADADNLFDLDSDPAVMRYLNGGIATPRSVIAQRILPGFLRSYERWAGYGVWAADERVGGAFVGWFGCLPRGKGAADAPCDIELGYRLRRACWGKGYATEGVRALIRKGFTELGAWRVLATTYSENLASRRVMEKAGLHLARSFRLSPAELAAESDTFVPGQEVWEGEDVEYELTRAEWEQSKRSNLQRELRD